MHYIIFNVYDTFNVYIMMCSIYTSTFNMCVVHNIALFAICMASALCCQFLCPKFSLQIYYVGHDAGTI